MSRSARVFRPLLVGGWVLLMPPVPLGTSLPPLSEWSVVSAHKTSEDCGRKREILRDQARRTVTSDPNASAMKVAGALGQLEARCVESGEDEPTSPDGVEDKTAAPAVVPEAAEKAATEGAP